MFAQLIVRLFVGGVIVDVEPLQDGFEAFWRVGLPGVAVGAEVIFEVDAPGVVFGHVDGK